MDIDAITSDIAVLRRRKLFLENRIKPGKIMSHDVRESRSLGRVIELVKAAIDAAKKRSEHDCY